MTPRNLFIITFIAIISVYLYVFGEAKTIEVLKEEYLFLLALVPLSLVFVFFRVKLKNYELIDFNKNSNLSLKTTIIFFLVFQVIDYISYDGFIGMISQWILYWIMGLIALLVIENINFYRNYKLIYNKS